MSEKKVKPFEPMLAKQCEDITALRYPILVSPKLDGVRAVVFGGKLMARSLKPIPNAYAQELFSGLPEGTDGELILGDPTDKDVYRNTVSAVMSEDGEPKKLRFWVFDNFKIDFPFLERYRCVSSYLYLNVVVVPHTIILDAGMLVRYEETALESGYEGAMVRSLDGPYKYGRSTVNEGYLLKLKRFKDAEAVVTGTYEFMHNDNEATTNELGRTHRSTHQENLRPAGILGGLEVRGVNGDYKGVDFRIGGGFLLRDPVDPNWKGDQDDPKAPRVPSQFSREFLWTARKQLIGSIAKYKYFPTGGKDKPRHPVFLGWRNSIDT